MTESSFSSYVPTARIKDAINNASDVPVEVKKRVVMNLETAGVFENDNIRLLFLGATMGAMASNIGTARDTFRLLESLYRLDQ